MELSGLLTSLGINMGICVLLFSIYSVLRKQPSNRGVYFARTLAQMRTKRDDPHWFDRFVPSPRWMLQAWELTEDEIGRIGGLDSVVFVKALVFSIRIFSIASIICLFLVLPLNYYGRDIHHKQIDAESLEVFTIQNVEKRSRWLWAHCLALYAICCSACILLYFEYKSVAKLRLRHLHESFQNPSHFTVLVRGIPSSSEENYDASVAKFFTKYYPTSYISHQVVYRCGKLMKLVKKAEKMYDTLSVNNYPMQFVPCKYCVRRQDSIGPEETTEKLDCKSDTEEPPITRKETGAAFVFFKTRYAAATVAQARQSSNPMLWVTELAPEPSDVYWSNLCVPYRQFWMRKIATFTATTAIMIFFLAPVALVQSLANLQQFVRTFPFLKGLLQKPTVAEVVTGYLPSVILLLFLLIVPPLMILFSTIEGSISRSGRKKAACVKVLYFNIWNVFFVNLASGTLLNQLSILSNPKDIPQQLANKAVPALVKFFMTYALTSGCTSLAIELTQLFPLIVNSIYKLILRKKAGPFDAGLTFPFHTEIPRVLLFGLLGFTFAILAPMILPLLLIYFCLAFFVYRNQILNVYLFEYDTGGQYWPVIHNTTIFSMVLAQIIAVGVFATKASPVCVGFTVVLIIGTLLFNVYCRQRFLPIFKDIAAQELIEMDQADEANERGEIYERLRSAYCQHDWVSYDDSPNRKQWRHSEPENGECSRHREGADLKPGEDLEKQLLPSPVRAESATTCSPRSPTQGQLELALTIDHGQRKSMEQQPHSPETRDFGQKPTVYASDEPVTPTKDEELELALTIDHGQRKSTEQQPLSPETRDYGKKPTVYASDEPVTPTKDEEEESVAGESGVSPRLSFNEEGRISVEGNEPPQLPRKSSGVDSKL